MDIIEETVIVSKVQLTEQEVEAIKTISSIKCEQIVCEDCPLNDNTLEYSKCIRDHVLRIAQENHLIDEE